MVIAWVGFATVGMFIARYMRPVWGEKNVCGKRMWFQVSHRNGDEQNSIKSFLNKDSYLIFVSTFTLLGIIQDEVQCTV